MWKAHITELGIPQKGGSVPCFVTLFVSTKATSKLKLAFSTLDVSVHHGSGKMLPKATEETRIKLDISQ